MKARHKLVAAAALSMALALVAPVAVAQSTPIQVIIPWAPGGSATIIGRMASNQLSMQLGRPVVVVNQPGAGGSLGAESAARAKPDGNTLLFTTVAVTITQALRKKPALDVRRDLTPLTRAVESSMGVYVYPGLPVRSIGELVAYAKANPGKLNYASSGVGSSTHLYAELLKEQAGIDIVHIPYAGGSAYPLSVAQNLTQLVIADSLGSPRALAASGKLRMIAVGSAARSRMFPDVPTVAESGVPGYAIVYWIGFFAPAALPQDLIDKLHSELVGALRADAVQGKLENQGYAVVASPAAEFGALIGKEVERWERLVKNANIEKN